ncbi:MAG: 2-phosphosulfolactate phosphatase, partial [Pirellulaceae bacterium]
MMLVRVHALPTLTSPAALADQTVVVVDVLRATTTMLCALQAGAVAIRPCLEVEEARALSASLAEATVLGGERGGQRIRGFALGNSPLEYTPETVGGRTVVMTTTNGTRALQTCRQAQRVVIGAFVNLSQIAEAIRAAPRITVLCAGTDQQVTREDVLFAGAVVSRLQQSNASWELNDEAELAVAAWHQLT